jgi:hypothetical protein
MKSAGTPCRSTFRFLGVLAALVPLLSTTAAAQIRIGGNPSGRSMHGTSDFNCNVVGPDRICSGGTVNYSSTIIPPVGGLTYSWTLSLTSTNGCPGTGTTNPSFCGPTNLPTVCVNPGTNAGRFVLRLFVTDGFSESVCCLSINVTPSTTTTDLVPGVVCHDTPYTFCTTAGGTGPFTYSWTRNGVLIPGATDSCYTAIAGPPATTDSYCVTTTGSGPCGVPVTSCASLTALVDTTTSEIPEVRRCQGQTFTFCTQRNFPGPYSYSWTRNGVVIPGETDSCYTATAGPPGTVDEYCVTVVGPCGPPVTVCGSLTTNVDATATDPPNAATCSGATHTFCTTAGGTGPFTYSWTRNGVLIPGATDSCYTATAGPQMTLDEFCVTVTGACGSATQCALLRALADTTATPLSPAMACEGDVRTFCTIAGGIGPFTYSWTRNGVLQAGETNNCFTTTAPPPGVTVNICVTVTGTCGPPVVQCTTFTGNLNTTATNPGSASECAGNTHTFCTVAGGTGPFVYAWKRNGVFIPGANASCYTATTGPAGTTDLYCVLVTGACNTVTQCVTLGSINCLGSYSSLTQGTYGDAGSFYNGVPSQTLVEELLQGDVTVGIAGIASLTLMPGGHDSVCVTDMLPSSGMTEGLPVFGDETLEQNCQTLPIPIPTMNGRFESVLLGQVVTLSLNLKLADGMTTAGGCTTLPTDLANQGVCQTMVSRRILPGPDGCMGTPDDTPDLLGPDGDPSTPDNLITITFPDTVISALNELQLTQTVGGLVELGNLALAGENTWTATLDEISAAVDAANLIFEQGREAVDCSHP